MNAATLVGLSLLLMRISLLQQRLVTLLMVILLLQQHDTFVDNTRTSEFDASWVTVVTAFVVTTTTTSRPSQSLQHLKYNIIFPSLTVVASYAHEVTIRCSCCGDNHNQHPFVATTTTTTTVSSLQEYILDRNVTIRSVNWCIPSSMIPSNQTTNEMRRNVFNTEASMLLQIYQGSSVPPAIIIGTESIRNRLNRIPNVTGEIQQFEGTVIEQLDESLLAASCSSMEINRTRLSSVLQERLYQYSRYDTIHSLTNTSNEIALSSYDITSLSMRLAAELRATQNTISDIQKCIKILYVDDHICVINKPSGILSVPGPRRNPNICEALYYLLNPSVPYHETNNNRHIDQMVVHRLDMDTSGILIFALSKEALQQLHTDFRQRRVTKVYQALLCNHMITSRNNGIYEYEINVDLERDPYHPPFMRIAQRPSYQSDSTLSTDKLSTPPLPPLAQNKFLNEESKPSLTEMQILSYEYIHDTIPVTRVQLIPHTGRTHQLRVHTAQVLQHPIVGDDIYGYGGECFRRDIDHHGNNNCHNNIHGHYDDYHHDSMLQVQRQLAELGIPLCLHAQKLYIRHPISDAPMMFECAPHF